MKLTELIQGIEIQEMHADGSSDVTGVSYDSRTVKNGDIFVAVKGFASDGHDYISAAVSRGASVVLCERKPACEIPYILTANTRRALAIVSRNWFCDPASEMKIIAVTGTNGKTTTTNLIKSILEHCLGAKVGLIGTNNNMIGSEVYETERTTPESYEIQALFRRMADAHCSHVVMEVSSHALYLDRVYGVTFELGIFTNLTPDHLDFHKTMEEYGAAKQILFTQCRKGIVNYDDEYAETIKAGALCPIYTFSAKHDEADLVAKSIKLLADSVEFCALTIGKLERIQFGLGIPGMFSVYNALASIAAGLNLGLEMSCLADALKKCSSVKGRAEVCPTNRDFTVIIDYAHSPDALENILRTVRDTASGRVVTVFGCGGDRDRTKRPVMGAIAMELSDFVIVTSDNPRTEEPRAIIDEILAGIQDAKTPYVVIENRREAIGWAIANAQKDDVILLAGKGHETYQILGKEKIHFDEREIVAEFLADADNKV